jgi:hypothetical protein
MKIKGDKSKETVKRMKPQINEMKERRLDRSREKER